MSLLNLFKKDRKGIVLDPDEVFVDSGNLPAFDRTQFEGVIERPISNQVIVALGVLFFISISIFLARMYNLQITRGAEYSELSTNNSLEHSVIFTERGVIYDRNEEELAWNTPERTYTSRSGLAHVLGYVSYPLQDEIEEGTYHPKEFIGRDGIEKVFNAELGGERGLKIVEVDVSGEIQSESILTEPINGNNVTLSIDAPLSEELYKYIRDLALERGFLGGSGVLMDVETGEILALSNYPEYDSNIMARAEDAEAIEKYRKNQGKPFLNRAIQGLYTPGSIFKPFVAVGALSEGIISKDEVIHTTGSIAVPNPYVPDEETVFSDWKDHGSVNMEDALAVSSNAYFYIVGGGYDGRQGLGIKGIEKYGHKFGFGEETGSGMPGEQNGFIPTPDWKEETFGDVWRIGDTYNTSIGQYNLQVTPIQVARSIAAIANGGILYTPSFRAGGLAKGKEVIQGIQEEDLEEMRVGMRAAVVRGTAGGLNIPGISVAAKTGTAEIDYSKKNVNSWVTGFFPYENPKYSFAVVMEKGPRENYIGGVFVMKRLLEWMQVNTPLYLE